MCFRYHSPHLCSLVYIFIFLSLFSSLFLMALYCCFYFPHYKSWDSLLHPPDPPMLQRKWTVPDFCYWTSHIEPPTLRCATYLLLQSLIWCCIIHILTCLLLTMHCIILLIITSPPLFVFIIHFLWPLDSPMWSIVNYVIYIAILVLVRTPHKVQFWYSPHVFLIHYSELCPIMPHFTQYEGSFS